MKRETRGAGRMKAVKKYLSSRRQKRASQGRKASRKDSELVQAKGRTERESRQQHASHAARLGTLQETVGAVYVGHAKE